MIWKRCHSNEQIVSLMAATTCRGPRAATTLVTPEWPPHLEMSSKRNMCWEKVGPWAPQVKPVQLRPFLPEPIKGCKWATSTMTALLLLILPITMKKRMKMEETIFQPISGQLCTVRHPRCPVLCWKNWSFHLLQPLIKWARSGYFWGWPKALHF